jgi:GNAT superfamily N-acetyltransferase
MTEADAAIRALADMVAALSVTCPGGWAERRPGVSAAASGSNATPLNRVIGEATDADLDDIAALVARLEDDRLPHMVESRPGADVLEQWCRDRGMTAFARVPLMTCSIRDFKAPSPDGTTHMRALDAAQMPEHVEVASLGYGMPREVLAGLDASTLFDQPFGAGLIAAVDGMPAATGVSVVAGDWVGVFIIATVDAYRRRGIGAALTAKLVTDAVARNGVTGALLQSSDMGKPVYESLGFATVEHWTRWTLPAS